MSEQENQEEKENNDQQQLSNEAYEMKQNNKYLTGLLDDDPERDQERKNLWKVFGRETAVGKELFSLYKCHQAPKINYPKPKQKQQDNIQDIQEKKPCPQQTKIEYPSLKQPPVYKIKPIDLVPKRKKENIIKDEIENYYRVPYIPPNKGVDRVAQIQKLGGLPKGAEMPIVNQDQIEITENMKKNALKRVAQKDKKFTGQNDQQKEELQSQLSMDPLEELNQIFDQVVAEIEERQQYLEEISHLQEPQMKEKIKKEIIERVAELQKITEMRKKYSNKKN